MKNKEYTGSVYIGVVGPDIEYAVCRDSIERILRHPGDEPPRHIRATKGYEARQHLIDDFMGGKHDFLLMLDSDMVFAPDTLQRLRSHKKPFVTGAYMRRQHRPVMAPVWFEPQKKVVWPHMPDTRIPKPGLQKVGASGWGCCLIHRDVITDTRVYLKGEKDIIEDDMDVYPYDLHRMMGAINGLAALVEEKPSMRVLRPALESYTEVLQEEFVPLRCSTEAVGSDIRYPFFARMAGYDLYLDPEVRPGHVIHYPLVIDDYIGAGPEYIDDLSKNNRKKVNAARREWRQRLKEAQDAEL